MRSHRTIFVGLDFSERDDLSIRTAADLARHQRSERIHLVHVVPPAPAWIVDSIDAPATGFASSFERSLGDAEAALKRVPLEVGARVTHEARIGPVARELAVAAAWVNADLIIIASHPRGRVGRFVLGSVASTLVRMATCPVLVVGPDRRLELPMRSVIAAIDGSPFSGEVLAQAGSFTEPAGRLHVLSACDADPPVRATPDASWTRYELRVNDLVRAAEVEGSTEIDVRASREPGPMIVEAIAASHPQLAVIGTSGHNAWERFFLGSTATRVLAEATCPVLVVPHVQGALLRSNAR